MDQKPFCLYPWYHQLVRTDGTAVPCCAFNVNDMPHMNYNNYFNSKWNKQLQTRMLSNDIHPGCKLCFKTEQNGGFSNRHESFELFNDDQQNLVMSTPTLLSQEVDLSNICNLKCRMCDSSRSSKWIQDEIALKRYSHKLRKSNWILQNPESILSLRFLGGEPMMHQEQIITELLKVEQLGRLHNLSLHFNSNMMQPILPELLDIFKKCNLVNINASIDGVGKLNDYIRSDSNWETVVTHIEDLHNICLENRNMFWMPINTVTVFNANKLEELYNWQLKFEKYGISTPPILVWEPSEFSIINLPNDVKLKLKRMYSKFSTSNSSFSNHWLTLISYLDNKRSLSETNFIEKFIYTNRILDQRRNTNFRDVNPEMADWLKI